MAYKFVPGCFKAETLQDILSASNVRKGVDRGDGTVGTLVGCIDTDGVNQGAYGTLDSSSIFHATGVIYGSGSYATEASRYTDPGKSNVVVGSDYTFQGASQVAEYPTTATSQAAQLAADQAVVLAAAASIKDDATILGQAGTYDFTAAIAAAYAAGELAQHATDAAFLEANKDEIIIGDASILAEFGVTGTAVTVDSFIITTEKFTVNNIDVVALNVEEVS